MSDALELARKAFCDAEEKLTAALLEEAKTEIRRLLPTATAFDIEGEFDEDMDRRGYIQKVYDANGVVLADRERDYGENVPYAVLWEQLENDTVDWYVSLIGRDAMDLQTIRIEVTP